MKETSGMEWQYTEHLKKSLNNHRVTQLYTGIELNPLPKVPLHLNLNHVWENYEFQSFTFMYKLIKIIFPLRGVID